MNRPKKEKRALAGEAGFVDIETYIQFESGEKYRYTLVKRLMGKTVGEAKSAMMNFEALNLGQVPARDVAISLMMPGKNVGEAAIELDLDEAKRMSDYFDDITCCESIKLKKLNQPALNTGNLLTR